MARFVVGDDRSQSTLFPERLDEYLGEDNPVRAIDVFVDELDLGELGFGGVEPEATGRPAYHPATLLKIYVYGYLNRVQSSRRLERECQRNIELVWLTGRLMPDFKTIADFRKDNGEAIRKVCREFVMLCRRLELFSEASVAIDGSKFKAVNTRDRNFTQAKMQRRLAQIDESIARYLSQLDSADRQGEAVPEAKITRLNEKIVRAAPGDRTPEPAELADDANRRQTDLADRSRCAIDGHEWPRQRDGRSRATEQDGAPPPPPPPPKNKNKKKKKKKKNPKIQNIVKPHVPVYFGGSSDAAARVAVKHCDVWATYGEPLAGVQERIDAIWALAAEYGRKPRISASFRPIIAPTEDAAWEKARGHPRRQSRRRARAPAVPSGRSRSARRRLREFAAESQVHDTRLWMAVAEAVGGAGNTAALVGTPRQVAESLAAYYDIGVTTLLIRGFDPLGDTIEYGRELIPALREANCEAGRSTLSQPPPCVGRGLNGLCSTGGIDDY